MTVPRHDPARSCVWLLLACLACSVSSASAGVPSAAATDDEGLTVLLVSASWHRADHLNLAFAGVDIDTPNLDALARRGVLFEDASTVATATGAAAASLLTGRPPPYTGVFDDETRLGDQVRSLATVFRAAGFVTCAVLGERALGEGGGLLAGFDHVDVPSDEARRPAHGVVARALAMLDDGSKRPHFLWVHLGDAAWPHEPSQAILDRYYEPRDDPRDARLRAPRAVLRAMPLAYEDVTDLAWPWARYKASITAIDEALGPLFDSPRVRRGVTLYVGSQGMSLGGQGLWYKAFGLTPGVLSVPLLLAAPGAPQGVRDARPASVLDVAQTLLRRASIIAVDFPGRDLLAPGERDGDRFALEDHGLSASLTRGDLHLVIPLQARKLPFLTIKRNAHEASFFDLAHDPLAEHDLLAVDEQEAAQVASAAPGLGERGLDMLRDLVDWLRVEPASGWWEQGEADPSEAALREALGYTGRPLETRRPLWQDDRCPICRVAERR